jgi:enoyl-CoA hydratase/carnithine racemase
MAGDRPLLVDRSEGLVTLTLNRPDRLNALNAQTVVALREAVKELGEDGTVRAVLLRGAGRAFCAGADLEELGGAREPKLVEEALFAGYLPVLEGLRRLQAPVLCAVQGAAVGIGCSLALACDLVVASEEAYLGLAFVRIGLAPDGGASALVAGRAGIGRFLDMALLGEFVGAKEAHRWGLVTKVVPSGELDREATDLAQRLASGPTRAYAAIKEQVNSLLLSTWQGAFELEARLQAGLSQTEDVAEGVAAFLAKRAPQFRGR